LLELNGIEEKKSLLLSRYLIEPKDQAMVVFNEELQKT